MAKTNKGLVEYCKAQLGRPYWYGTFGQIASKKLLSDKAYQYPRQFSNKRLRTAEERGDFGKKVHDCYGLYKGYLMSAGADSEAVYDKKYDISADTAYNRASEKGTIDTLPEIVGIGLWKKGHFGVYIGGGKEIEARGFDYGVVEDQVKNTTFTHWFKLPEIEYTENSKPVETAKPSEDHAPTVEPTKDDTYIVKKGDTLSKIAAKTGLTVAELVKWNNIEDPNIILVGQKIRLTNPVKDAVDTPKEYFEAIVNTISKPLNIRAGASTNSAVLGTFPKGAIVKIAYISGGWAKLYGRSGFVKVDFIKPL